MPGDVPFDDRIFLILCGFILCCKVYKKFTELKSCKYSFGWKLMTYVNMVANGVHDEIVNKLLMSIYRVKLLRQ